MKTRLEKAISDGNGVAEKSEKFEIVDLGPFEHNRNDVQALNDVAQCAGVCFNYETGRIEGFRQQGGTRRMLGTLGGSFSVARGLNNSGEVVGGSLTEGDDNFHGFLYRNGRLFDLNDFLESDANCELHQAIDINNRGEIIAIGCRDGEDRILLLRPKNTKE